MNKFLKFSFVVPVVLLQLLFFTGCATQIKLAVERPPNLNTTGIKRIAVMPFEPVGSSEALAQHATSVAGQRIRAMNHFTLVDPGTIDQLRRSGQSIEAHVDALFVGKVMRAVAQNKTTQGQFRQKDGSVVTVTNFHTDVEVELEYSLVRARDGSLIGPVTRTGRRSAVGRDGHPAAEPMARGAIEGILSGVGRDLAPHTVIESRTFAKDNSTPALKNEMNAALAHVKAGNHRPALAAYLAIYERHKSAAAAENAAYLHEALGDVQAAADLMKRVFDETGNVKIGNVLARLNKIIQDQATIASDYAEAQSPIDRVTAFASSEIRKILPQETMVWIYNNSPNNTMAEAVTDNITADFIRNGIKVVDRQNAALIEAEQIFHMSGAVSDDDITRIGNAAGANTIAIIGITGTGAMRRLQVRVLDIERGVPILQSDTSEKWQL